MSWSFVNLWSLFLQNIVVECLRIALLSILQNLSWLCFLTMTYILRAFHCSPSRLCLWLGCYLWLAVSFAEHISNLSWSSFYDLKHLQVVVRSVPSSIFPSLVHAFVWLTWIIVTYWSCEISPRQSVLNAAAHPIACLLTYLDLHGQALALASTHLPAFCFSSFRTSRAFFGQASCSICDLIFSPISAASACPHCSLDQHDILLPLTATALHQLMRLLALCFGPIFHLWLALWF